ncbi:MAG: hypothetical protein GF320_14220 [Armatimonadia bacterium]|nr:hypothetical protein [Armatimonadia bacterium]
MPAGIVEPWVKACTSERGVCANCGAPWTRVTRSCDPRPPRTSTAAEQAEWNRAQGFPGGTGCIRRPGGNVGTKRVTETTGWVPSCGCHLPQGPDPAVVLDPFCGSGTVGVVAISLGRSFVGIDANPEYLALAEERIAEAREEQRQLSLFDRDREEQVCQTG